VTDFIGVAGDKGLGGSRVAWASSGSHIQNRTLTTTAKESGRASVPSAEPVEVVNE
jgi:hypothetical protein